MGGSRFDQAIPAFVGLAHTNKVAASRIEVANMIRPTSEMTPLFASDSSDRGSDGDVLLDVSAIERRATGSLASGSDDAMPATRGETLAASLAAAPEGPVDDHVVLVSSADNDAPPTQKLDVPKIEPVEPTFGPPRDELAALRDSSPVIEQQIDLHVIANADGTPTPVDEGVTDRTVRPPAQTTLGVAPLEPATVVRAPFVIDTPVQAPSPLPWVPTAARASTEPGGTLPRAPAEIQAINNLVASVELPGARPERTAMIALDPGSGMPRKGMWKAVASLAKRVRSVRWWISKRRRTEIVRRR